MKSIKKFACSAVLTALVVVPSVANAVTFTGTGYGEWQSPTTHPGSVYNINNSDHGDKARVTWGAGCWWGCTPTRSTMTFDGVGSDGEGGWSTSDSTPFLIGNLAYYNGRDRVGTGIEGVDLFVSLGIDSPLSGSFDDVFAVGITNTLNAPGGTDDIIAINNNIPDISVFWYNGVQYTLTLLGFSVNGGSTFQNQFSVAEATAMYAGLYAQITAASDIPEPTTLVLLGAGLLGAYRVRRKVNA